MLRNTIFDGVHIERVRFKYLKGNFPTPEVIFRSAAGQIYKRAEPKRVEWYFEDEPKVHLSDYHPSASNELCRIVYGTTNLRHVTCQICRECLLLGLPRASYTAYKSALKKVSSPYAPRMEN